MTQTIAITKSIVVVDDEPDVVELFRDALSSYGYDVEAFTDPLVALDHIRRNPKQYNLLITDFSMSKLNGCALGIKVKELNDKIKVLLISAYENIECSILNYEMLNKPIPIQTLIDKVNRYMK